MPHSLITTPLGTSPTTINEFLCKSKTWRIKGFLLSCSLTSATTLSPPSSSLHRAHTQFLSPSFHSQSHSRDFKADQGEDWSSQIKAQFRRWKIKANGAPYFYSIQFACCAAWRNLPLISTTVCRNSNGRLMDEFARSIKVSSAARAEVRALVEALEFFKSWSAKELAVETDHFDLISGISSTEQII